MNVMFSLFSLTINLVNRKSMFNSLNKVSEEDNNQTQEKHSVVIENKLLAYFPIALYRHVVDRK